MTIVAGSPFGSTYRAQADVIAGRIIVLVDDISTVPSVALVVGAERVTTAQMATIIEHCSGFVEICLDLTTARRLAIPLMFGADPLESGEVSCKLWGVAVDATGGITTGISAKDRAYTARLVAAPTSTADDLRRPGHLVPVLVPETSVLAPTSLTSGAVTLMRTTGCATAAVCSELVSTVDPTSMATADEAERFASDRGMSLIRLSELQVWI